MSQLFISDLHLYEGRADLTHAFLAFLIDKAAGADSLYILGDFFEVWLGDDHDTPFNRQIIDALSQLDKDKYVMHGNRDFLIGQDFCDAVGATLLPDPTTITVNGRPVLLMHGDSLCTRDEQYMAARKRLRNPAVQADLLSKSIEERAAIARGARAESKAHTRETADDIMDVTPSEVTRVMAEEGVRLLIHGHTHRPAIHDIEVDGEPAQRIVLGDWDRLGWFLEAHEDGFRLASFEIQP